MTADETGPGTRRAPGRGAGSAAKAYERRLRRENTVASARLTRTGSPIAAAMSRVPFVATIILLLAAGIVGVLWLNTMSDATGLKATDSRVRQAAIKTDIEALQRDVNTMRDPARLAAEANKLGLVPAGDSALLVVGADGKGTVIGTPTPVPGQAPPAPAAPATTTAAAAATTAPAAPATTTAAAATTATAAPATTATTPTPPPPKTTPVTTAPAKTTPVTTTPAKTTPVTTTPVTTTPATTTPAKTTPAKTTPAKSTAARTAPAQSATTTTGAGR
jgi:hypothetical protein